MHYFYILYSEKDNGCYYGSTSDLKSRLAEHLSGKVKSTSIRTPLRLVYYEAYEQKVQATLREATVKRSQSARKALHQRIQFH